MEERIVVSVEEGSGSSRNIATLKRGVDGVEQGAQRATRALAGTSSEVRKLGGAASPAGDAMARLSGSTGRARDAMGRFTGANRDGKDALDKLSGSAKQATDALGRTTQAAGRADAAFGKLSGRRKDVDELKAAVDRLAKATGGLEAASDFMLRWATAPLIGIGIAALKVGGDMESLRLSLIAVEGSTERAELAWRRLEGVAKLPGLGMTEAVQGYNQLRAVEIGAGLAERSLRAFGNALATAGRGKDDLNGVVTQLVQMQSKGKIAGQELLIMRERVPQLGAAMKAAFGTGDIEAIRERGITTTQFIQGVVTELEKLPAVAGGFKNTWENFGDSAKKALDALASTLLPTVTKWLTKGADALETYGAAWRSLDPPMRRAIGTTVLVVAAIGPALRLMVMLRATLTTLGSAIALVNGLMGVTAARTAAATAALTANGVASRAAATGTMSAAGATSALGVASNTAAVGVTRLAGAGALRGLATLVSPGGLLLVGLGLVAFKFLQVGKNALQAAADAQRAAGEFRAALTGMDDATLTATGRFNRDMHAYTAGRLADQDWNIREQKEVLRRLTGTDLNRPGTPSLESLMSSSAWSSDSKVMAQARLLQQMIGAREGINAALGNYAGRIATIRDEEAMRRMLREGGGGGGGGSSDEGNQTDEWLANQREVTDRLMAAARIERGRNGSTAALADLMGLMVIRQREVNALALGYNATSERGIGLGEMALELMTARRQMTKELIGEVKGATVGKNPDPKFIIGEDVAGGGLRAGTDLLRVYERSVERVASAWSRANGEARIHAALALSLRSTLSGLGGILDRSGRFGSLVENIGGFMDARAAMRENTAGLTGMPADVPKYLEDFGTALVSAAGAAQTFISIMRSLPGADAAMGALLGRLPGVGGLAGNGLSQTEQLLKQNADAISRAATALEMVAITFAQRLGAGSAAAQIGRLDLIGSATGGGTAVSNPFTTWTPGGGLTGGDSEQVNALLQQYGITFRQLLGLAEEQGIELLGAGGRLLPEAFSQLADALGMSIQALVQWGRGLDDQRSRAELYDQLFNPGTANDPASMMQRELTLLQNNAGALSAQFGLAPGNFDLATTGGQDALRAALQRLFLATDTTTGGNLLANNPALLGSFANLQELMGVVGNLTGGLNEMREQIEGVNQALNVPLGFKRLALMAFDADRPDPFAPAPPSTGGASGLLSGGGSGYGAVDPFGLAQSSPRFDVALGTASTAADSFGANLLRLSASTSQAADVQAQYAALQAEWMQRQANAAGRQQNGAGSFSFTFSPTIQVTAGAGGASSAIGEAVAAALEAERARLMRAADRAGRVSGSDNPADVFAAFAAELAK